MTKERSDLKRLCVPWAMLVALAVVGGPGSARAELPAGWSATPWESCDREPFRLTAEGPGKAFARQAVALARDARVAGNSLRWEFVPNPTTAEAALQLAPPLPAADGLAVWLKNPGRRALALALRLTNTAGETSVTPAQPLDMAPKWVQYEFLTAGVAGAVTPPYTRVQLVFTGLQPGQPHVLYLDELTVLTAPLPELRVDDLTAPAQADAGGRLAVQAALVAAAPLLRPARLTVALEREGVPGGAATLMVQPADLAPGKPLTVTAELVLPRHLAGGQYRVRLGSDQAKLTGLAGRDVQVRGAKGPRKCTVGTAAQGGAFVVDGQSLPPIGGLQSRERPCREAPWVMVHLTAGLSGNGVPLTLWTGPEEYDFALADRLLGETLQANPNAYLVPIIHVDAPGWWRQQHPRDLMIFGNGKPELPAGVPSFARTHASWASKTWRQEAGVFVTKLVQHLEQGPLGPAILGYQVAAGEGGSWVYPGVAAGLFADYSGPQQQAFSEWLKRKYGDVKALRVAWGQPAAPVTTPEGLKEARPILGWSQAKIPDSQRRSAGSVVGVRDPGTAREALEFGVLHDPTDTQDVVDYQVFHSDLAAETLRLFAQTVRLAAGGNKVVGAAYGLIFDLAAPRGGLQNGGQLALGPMSQAAEVDFLTTPAPVEAGSLPLLTTVHTTLASHGKLWVGTADAPRGVAGVALPLCQGGVVAQEGYTPELWSERLNGFLGGTDRRGVSEVAVIVDDISAAYLGCGKELPKPLLSDQRLGLALLGAPCDVWLLDDVMTGRVPRYKLYIFLNAFYLDGESRTTLVQYLNAEPCTALWIYAAGALDQTLGGRVMKDLTGMTLVQRPGKGPLQVKVNDVPPYTYGASLPLAPRFVCADDQADVRGQLVGTDYGGLAVKPYGQIRSVWSAAPHLPAGLLRNLAREAGVHLYADNGASVVAARGLLAVRATDTPTVVRLREAADVYELATGKLLGRSVKEFRPVLPAGSSALYYLAPAGTAAKPAP